ncbi:MAG: phytoene desaturase [Flavobacteriales bacterium]|nr:phytoene desaturase [Flavobacteriales bacterium]
MSKSVAVIGSGFAGLSAASYLAQAGFDVHVFEKNSKPGGRARSFTAEGFSFDMGPSWYWMPDVFEKYFADFGKTPSDYYDLKRLSPSYRVFFEEDDVWDIPSKLSELYELFDSVEPGAGKELKAFLKDAAYKYDVGMNRLVYKPSESLLEFVEKDIIVDSLKLQLFTSISSLIRKHFKNPKLHQLLEFPVLFLGAKPQNTPALYSLMNYADMELGTWYPDGGMVKIADGMYDLAKNLGVKFHFNAPIESIIAVGSEVIGVRVENHLHHVDFVVGGADYHHIEAELLQPEYRNYTNKYWNSRTMAPSSLLFYLGVNKKVDNLLHHNLFFDTDFEKHAKEIYDLPEWPSEPLFYVCAPSKTDDHVAPEGCENLFVLMPIAPDLKDNDVLRQKYYHIIMDRLEKFTQTNIRDHVVYKKSFAVSDFKSEYNSFKGNAYGLANTLKQTAFLKPKMRNKKLSNLFYTGQLTTPGPGVPPSLISGKVVAELIQKQVKKHAHESTI